MAAIRVQALGSLEGVGSIAGDAAGARCLAGKDRGRLASWISGTLERGMLRRGPDVPGGKQGQRRRHWERLGSGARIRGENCVLTSEANQQPERRAKREGARRPSTEHRALCRREMRGTNTLRRGCRSVRRWRQPEPSSQQRARPQASMPFKRPVGHCPPKPIGRGSGAVQEAPRRPLAPQGPLATHKRSLASLRARHKGAGRIASTHCTSDQ